MDTGQKKQIASLLEDISKLNIPQIITDYFESPEQQKIRSYEIENYSLTGYIDTTIKVIVNFSRELQTLSWPSLMIDYSHEEHGNRDLTKDIDTLHKSLSKGDLGANFLFALESVVYYQRTNNFWYSNEALIRVESLTEAESIVLAKKALFENSQKTLDELITSSKQVNDDLLNLMKKSDEEKRKLELTNQNTTEEYKKIINLVNEINKNKGATDEITKSINERADSTKKRTEDELKKFDDFKNQSEALQKNIKEKSDLVTSIIELWDGKLESIKTVEQLLKDKEKEINDLMSLAAGYSLFHSFQSRKIELNKPVSFWRWAVGGMTALLTLSVIIIFSLSPITTPYGINWGIFALNTLKSLPIVILLYFAIRQYNKERTFQEEYAFKSSVALTVNAFADKLSDTRSSKDRLIMESVNRIYETPNSMREKGNWGIRYKPLNETLKNLTDAIKEFKK